MGKILKHHETIEDSIYTFVKDYKLERQFEKMTGQNIDKYNNNECDIDLINKLLKKHVKGTFLTWYDDEREGIWIFEVKNK